MSPRPPNPGSLPGSVTPPRRGPRLALAALLLSALGAACVAGPGQEISQAELLLDMSDAVSHLRVESAVLQEQVDSLHAVVARQDSLLRRLAAVTGTPLTP